MERERERARVHHSVKQNDRIAVEEVAVPSGFSRHIWRTARFPKDWWVIRGTVNGFLWMISSQWLVVVGLMCFLEMNEVVIVQKNTTVLVMLSSYDVQPTFVVLEMSVQGEQLT